MHRTIRRSLLGATLLSLSLASPAFAGPPWISIEYPANPFNSTTKGAFCLVRVYHHGDPIGYPVSGTAEGLVNGQRQSVKLELASTSVTGVYAVRYTAPAAGAWVLVINLGTGDEMSHATALVTVGRNGEIANVRVPTQQKEGWIMPAPVSPSDVETMLKAQVAAASSEAGHGANGLWLAGIGLMLIPLGLRRRG